MYWRTLAGQMRPFCWQGIIWPRSAWQLMLSMGAEKNKIRRPPLLASRAIRQISFEDVFPSPWRLQSVMQAPTTQFISWRNLTWKPLKRILRWLESQNERNIRSQLSMVTSDFNLVVKQINRKSTVSFLLNRRGRLWSTLVVEWEISLKCVHIVVVEVHFLLCLHFLCTSMGS